MKINHWSI